MRGAIIIYAIAIRVKGTKTGHTRVVHLFVKRVDKDDKEKLSSVNADNGELLGKRSSEDEISIGILPQRLSIGSVECWIHMMERNQVMH